MYRLHVVLVGKQDDYTSTESMTLRKLTQRECFWVSHASKRLIFSDIITSSIGMGLLLSLRSVFKNTHGQLSSAGCTALLHCLVSAILGTASSQGRPRCHCHALGYPLPTTCAPWRLLRLQRVPLAIQFSGAILIPCVQICLAQLSTRLVYIASTSHVVLSAEVHILL